MTKWLALAWVFHLLPVSPSLAQVYSIQALGPPPTGPQFIYASTGWAVNNKDEVLAGGVWGQYSGTPSMFLLSPDYGVPAGLNYLPFFGATNMTVLALNNWIALPYSERGPGAQAFNDQGQILGTLLSPTNACVWQNGQITKFGSLGGGVSYPFAINQNGDIIGYSTTVPGSTNMRPFLILSGTTNMQAIAEMDENSVLVGFNKQRQILFSNRTNFIWAFSIWQSGSVQKLADIMGIPNVTPPVVNPADPTGNTYFDGTYNSINVRTFNDNGEMYGHLVTVVVQNEGTNKGDYVTNKSFFYSPSGGNGLKPGLNYDVLPDVYQANMIIAMNNTGQIIYLKDYNTITNPFSYDFYLWDKGQDKPIQNLVPAGSGWTYLVPLGLNDRGDIVGTGFSNGVSQAFLLALPGLSDTVSATPAVASVGDQIIVTVTAINNNQIAPGTITNVQFYLPLYVTGTGGAKPKSIPTLPAAVTLPPGGIVTFTQVFVATKNGPVTFGATVSGNDPKGIVVYAAGHSAPVNIVGHGDLLIKRGFESASAYAGAGIYQGTPMFPQVETNAVVTNQPSIFQVEIVNPTPQALTYTVRALEDSPAGWSLQYKLGSQDVTAQLESSSGGTLPELAPGASLVLDATMTPLTVPTGAVVGVEFQLSSADNPTLTLDAVKAVTLAERVPVQLRFHRLNDAGLTTESIMAGMNDINAPLEPGTDLNQLRLQPVLTSASPPGNDSLRGLVADGVTPLLVEVLADPNDLGPFPEGHQFRASVTLAGGTLNGTQIGDALQVLDPQTGLWSRAPVFRLTADHSTAFLWIAPIGSDDVQLAQKGVLGTTYQLAAQVIITDVANSAEAQDSGGFRIRKPPIFLVHGYSTAGDWDPGFKAVFTTWHQTLPETSPDNFVRTIKYGQDTVQDASSGESVYANTANSLEDCAVMAHDAMNEAKRQIQQSWAMTRFDVVGHSQGGVLARMLSSKNGNSKISDPFRGKESYDRGRFHRVVTIGAPHNGTRLLHYLAKLIARARVESPSIAAALRPLQPILQSKFDPFGQQFRDINNPDLGAPWYPDPAAPFHLIRTSIDLGASPTTGDTIPAYKMMGLAQAGGGAAVIPRGSDGVVDYDSEGANVPPASLGANVDDVPGAVLAISHTFLHGLFSANEAQVDSTTVARHVRNALDQNGLDPTENIQFAGFQLPPTLADSQRQMIDDWAAKAVFARNAAKIVAQMPSPRPLPIHIHSSSFSSYVNKVEYLNGQLPQGDVNWLATVYGSQGITTNGLNLAVQGPNNSEVVVTLDDSLVGDVVLQAFYIDASNEVVATPPQLVVSHSPLGVTLTGLELLPSNPTLPVGTEINAQLMARYSDGTSSLRYVTADQVTAKSSDTNIVSVDNPLGWELLAPGTAQVVVAWSGLEVTNQVSVFVSVPALPALSIRSGNDGTLRVSWPSWASDFVLESAGDLSPANGWQPVSGAPSTNGLVLTLAVPGPHATDYFRLRR